MVDIKDVKSYRDAIMSEFKDRIELAQDNANGSETQNEKDNWEGYANGMSDAIEVVNEFFNLFINDNENLNK